MKSRSSLFRAARISFLGVSAFDLNTLVDIAFSNFGCTSFPLSRVASSIDLASYAFEIFIFSDDSNCCMTRSVDLISDLYAPNILSNS